jgi:hypothetical protein
MHDYLTGGFTANTSLSHYCRVKFGLNPQSATKMQQQGSKSGSEMEVTWEDQQNINIFSRLNNRVHDLDDDIKSAKVLSFMYP